MQPSIRMFFKVKQPDQQASPKVPPLAREVQVSSPPINPHISYKRPAEDENDATPTKRPAFDHLPSTPKLSTPRTPASRLQTPKTPGPSPAINNHAESDDRQHAHRTYRFLYPPHRRDIENRSPDDPEYDERTLYVPESFLNSQTPALRQWWLIKQRNMDTILFFKMGKFYELFNEDAVICVQELDIIYMKGDEHKPAHAGFPEVSYEKYSKILIERGYKVMRIEQTETPAMMEERCRKTGCRGKFDKVVKREVCQVTSKGTQLMGVMENAFHTASHQYLLSIYESDAGTGDSLKTKVIGLCFIDVTVSRMYLSQFEDDHNLSKLNILLAHHPPAEILYEKGNLTQNTLQTLLRTGAVMNALKPKKEFWPIKTALSYLKTHDIFQGDANQSEWPPLIKSLFQEGSSSESILALEPKEEYKWTLQCFAAIVFYLQSQLIVGQVLSGASYDLYRTPLDRTKKEVNGFDSVNNAAAPMILDHIALRNLEIFANSSGGTKATLFESINHCKTHFGQRLLRNWLCSPLCVIKQIENRQEAVEALTSNNSASLMNELSHHLSKTPDLERLLTKIKCHCYKSASDTRAIMFDGNQHSKAKISSFLTLINNFKRLQDFITSIHTNAQRCYSDTLKRLLTFTTKGGLYPDYSATLDYFENAFDHESAAKTGTIVPAPGVDRKYDKCLSEIEHIKTELSDYLEEQKAALKCRQIEYFGNGKTRYQLQIPEQYCDKVPSSYYIETTRKGFKRYYTPTITKLLQKLSVHEEEMKKALDNIMSEIFKQFVNKIKLWSAAIECIAIVDALQSIACFVRSLRALNVDICRPTFIDNNQKPLIHYKGGCHPALIKLDPNYISNDLLLDERLILLSGANMGGKSTVMRQTALLVVLAQIGCFVPATEMQLTPVDRIFSRLGASDSLMDGESTFYTELVETSSMLRCSTRNSLLLLDELGRGTSTYDGTAIAYSVLREISENIKCRCLFSTHYHTLVRDFEGCENVRLSHMACKIEKVDSDALEEDPLKENITFLYKIAEGPVGRSYGFNVAKLAGIDEKIIKAAHEKARILEVSSKILEIAQQISKKEGQASIGSVNLKCRVLHTLKSEKNRQSQSLKPLRVQN